MTNSAHCKKMSAMDGVQELIRMIEQSSSAAAFTGAGVSTLSGIKDFRGDGGIYQDVDGEKLFDVSWFYKEPELYYRYAKDLIYSLHTKTPSLVHQVLAALEGQGYLPQGVITQNIDLLHEKAGTKKISAVHGTPAVHHCLDCRASYSYEDVLPAASRGEVPYCESCGGVIKPDIVFFGESLPQDELTMAFRIASSADLLLVLGSSLVVQPAASIPLHTLDSGGKLVIVNRTPTPLDEYAAMRFYDLHEVFEGLRAHFCTGN